MIRKLSGFVLLLLTSSGVLTSCKSTVSSPAKTNNSEEVSAIIFVNLRIFRDASDLEVIELVSKAWAQGTLKKNPAEENRHAANPLVCEFLDSKENTLASVTLQNPLTTLAEQYSPDGSIERKEAKNFFGRSKDCPIATT